MGFTITGFERRARARADLRMGLPVAVRDGDRIVVAAAVETLSAARLAEMRVQGTPVIAVTNWRAQTLAAPPYDTDLVRIAVPADAGVH